MLLQHWFISPQMESGSWWFIVGSAVRKAGVHMYFSSCCGHLLGYLPGEAGLLSMCHFSNYAGISCVKELLFLHYLSLMDHKLKLNSLGIACGSINVFMLLG